MSPVQLTDLLELTDRPPLSPGGCSEAAQQALDQLLAATAAGSKPEDLSPVVRDELELWLRRQLVPLAERLGCSLQVLPPWAGQAAEEAAASKGQEGEVAKPADGKQQQQQTGSKATTGGRKKGKGAAAVAAETAAEADAGPASPSAAAAGNTAAAAAAATAAAKAATSEPPRGRLPTAAYLHPYTALMLRHPVQQHTVQQALETPALDAHAAGLPRTTTMGQLESVAAGGAAAGEGDAAATPAASALTATPGTGGALKEVPSVANLSSLVQQPAATASTAAVASTAGAVADTAGTAEVVASPAAADGTPLEGAADGAAGQPQPSSTAPSRAGGRARAVSNYALLAGKKQTNRNAMGPPKKVGAGGRCACQAVLRVVLIAQQPLLGAGLCFLWRPAICCATVPCKLTPCSKVLAPAGGAHPDSSARSGGSCSAPGGPGSGGHGGSR